MPGLQNKSRFPNRTGMTLIEVVIYISVLGLLLAGVYGTVITGFRYLRLAQAQETANQQASTALSQICQELENSSQTGYVIGGTPGDQHVIFLSLSAPQPADPDDLSFSTGSQPDWQKWVCFYKNSSNQLVRTELATGTGPDPVPSNHTPPNFTADILPLTGQPVAQNIFKLDFDDTNIPRVEVVVETRVETNTGTVTQANSSNLRLEGAAVLLNP